VLGGALDEEAEGDGLGPVEAEEVGGVVGQHPADVGVAAAGGDLAGDVPQGAAEPLGVGAGEDLVDEGGYGAVVAGLRCGGGGVGVSGLLAGVGVLFAGAADGAGPGGLDRLVVGGWAIGSGASSTWSGERRTWPEVTPEAFCNSRADADLPHRYRPTPNLIAPLRRASPMISLTSFGPRSRASPASPNP
jgi:hypothetical protein